MGIVQIIIIIVIFLAIKLIVDEQNKRKKNIHSLKQENFDPVLDPSRIDYSRVYPGTFSYNYGYGPYYKPFHTLWQGFDAESKFTPSERIGRNIRYGSGYRDYWYIPAHEYLNRWANGVDGANSPNGMILPFECKTPSITDKDCVVRQIEKHGNLDLAVEACTQTQGVSGSCPLLANWSNEIR